MKVKELIKFLKECPGEAIVLTREYDGCYHSLWDVSAELVQKGRKMPRFDGTRSDVVDSTGLAKADIVLILDE